MWLFRRALGKPSRRAYAKIMVCKVDLCIVSYSFVSGLSFNVSVFSSYIKIIFLSFYFGEKKISKKNCGKCLIKFFINVIIYYF